MRSRRKRKKQQGAEETVEASTSPYTSKSNIPASQELNADAQIPSPVDELGIELDDSFDEDLTSTTSTKGSLPSNGKKSDMRVRKAVETLTQEKAEKAEEAVSEDTIVPEPKRPTRMRQSARTAYKAVEDELESLDDDKPILPYLSNNPDSTDPSPETVTESIEPESIEREKTSEATELPTLKESLNDSSNEEAKSNKEPQVAMPATPPVGNWKSLLKDKLQSLALIEQISIGLIVLILAIVAICSSNILSANIPDTIVASKLKYPLQGNAVSIASFESYWRKPIREGEKVDEEVSDAINDIPEIKITLTSDSKAKALRFLFRDEKGRLVGDSTTLQTSGGKFLPTRSVTASVDGATAIIHSTAGFRFAGELISYLADDDFQWEVVILESQDGQKYQEFIAIPISPNRKN